MKKILAAVLSCAMLGAAACSGETTGQPETGEYATAVANFEEYDDVYNILMSWYNTGTIGRWEINKDSRYVSEGTGSAKWTMDASVAEVWQQTRMDCAQPMVAHYYLAGNLSVDMTDMSKVRCISVDCYNANDFEVTFGGCIFTEETFTYASSSVTVKPGRWATLKIRLNPFIAGKYFTAVRRITFTVDYDHKVMEKNSEVAKKGQLYYPQAVVYIDNMYAVKDDAPVQTNKNFADEKEILYFNDLSDVKYVNPYLCNGENDWLERNIRFAQGVSASFTSNPCYTNGKKGALEVRFDPWHSVRRDWKTNYTYDQMLGGIEIVGVTDKINFLPLQTKNYKLAVDVYNDFSFDKEVFFGMDDNVNKFNYVTENEYPYEIGCKFPLYNMYKLKAKTWTTIYFDRAEHLDLSQGVARIKFASSKLDINRSGSFYLNNLRLVKEEIV